MLLLASGGAMLAPSDTPHRLDRGDVDDQAAVALDRKGVAGVDDRRRPWFFDGGRPIDVVARAKSVALEHAVFERITCNERVDLARLEHGRATGAPLERGQARRVERENNR